MRTILLAAAVCAILAVFPTSVPSETSNQPNQPIRASNLTPLILEKNEGEQRVWRPIEGAKGWNALPGPFTLKVDRHNGGSSHLVFGTEDLPPGRRSIATGIRAQTRFSSCRTGLHG